MVETVLIPQYTMYEYWMCQGRDMMGEYAPELLSQHTIYQESYT